MAVMTRMFPRILVVTTKDNKTPKETFVYSPSSMPEKKKYVFQKDYHTYTNTWNFQLTLNSIFLKFTVRFMDKKL